MTIIQINKNQSMSIFALSSYISLNYS